MRCFHSRSEWTSKQCQWRGTPHSPKPQYYWSPTIRLFSVISRILVRGVLPLCRDAVIYSAAPAGWAFFFLSFFYEAMLIGGRKRYERIKLTHEFLLLSLLTMTPTAVANKTKSSLHMVLWHINHCRLFNGKSSSSIYY